MSILQSGVTGSLPALCAVVVMALGLPPANAYTLPTGQDALVKWADSCQDYTGKSWCNVATATTLLKNGADPNVADQVGTPALHRVIDNGLDVEIVKLIIDGGARVNQRDKLGAAPLHHLRYWNPQLLEVLLKAGADINAQDAAGYTALMYAVLDTPNQPYAEALLTAGANASLKSKGGETALSIAEKRLEEHKRSAAEPGRPSGLVEASRKIIAWYEEIVRLLKAAGGAKGVAVAGATAKAAANTVPASSTALAFRPKCNVRVGLFDAPKQSVVPIGTVLYKCPDERAGVEGRLVAEGYFKLVGEYGDWYEYEGKGGRIGYFRKTGVTMRATPESTVAGANGSQPSTSGGAMSGGAAATRPSGEAAVATSAEVNRGQVTAPPGVEYEKSNLPCPKPAPPGQTPGIKPPGVDANVYVPDDFDMTNDAMVKQVLIFGAEQWLQECDLRTMPNAVAEVRVFPKSDKTFVAGTSGFGILRRDADTTSVLEWARGWAGPDTGVKEDSYRNHERDRIRDCEPVTAFYKRTKAQQITGSALAKNPLALQGKVVAMSARFEHMEGPNEATFERESDYLRVTGVPSTRFTDSRELLLVVRVKGLRKVQSPFGGEMSVVDLVFVDAYEEKYDDICRREAIRYAKRP